MNIIDKDVLHTILTSHDHSETSTIRIVDWHTNDNIVKIGGNMTSQVFRLVVRYHTETGGQTDDTSAPRVKNFFLKVPSNVALYQLFKSMNCYDKEIAVYTEVLPQMYTIEDEYFTPRFYHYDDKMSLIMEDLSQFGYVRVDRVQQLDFEHCFYALKCLAKFHALSVKLEKTEGSCGLPALVKHHSLPSIDENTHDIDDFTATILPLIPIFVDNLSQNLKDRYPHMVAYCMKLSSRERLSKMYDHLSPDMFKVLNHGDFKINNIMYKYDKYGIIENIKLVDFQFTSWVSPVKDLIFFTITSMKFEVYSKYFPLLLKTYLDALNKILHRLDCPVYNMSSLLDDMDAMYDFALIILCGVLPRFLRNAGKPIDPKEISKDDKFATDSLAEVHEQHIRDITNSWFEYFARKGTLRVDEENIH